MKILFVCRGNVGRSQIAAALYKKMEPNDVVISAGTRVQNKDGESRHGFLMKDTKGAEKVIDVLKEEGVDVGLVPRTQLSPEMLVGVDRVIVMSEPEHIPEWLSSHAKYVYWNVKDPKDAPIEFHREIKNQIKRLIEDNKELFA